MTCPSHQKQNITTQKKVNSPFHDFKAPEVKIAGERTTFSHFFEISLQICVEIGIVLHFEFRGKTFIQGKKWIFSQSHFSTCLCSYQCTSKVVYVTTCVQATVGALPGGVLTGKTNGDASSIFLGCIDARHEKTDFKVFVVANLPLGMTQTTEYNIFIN